MNEDFEETEQTPINFATLSEYIEFFAKVSNRIKECDDIMEMIGDPLGEYGMDNFYGDVVTLDNLAQIDDIEGHVKYACWIVLLVFRTVTNDQILNFLGYAMNTTINGTYPENSSLPIFCEEHDQWNNIPICDQLGVLDPSQHLSHDGTQLDIELCTRNGIKKTIVVFRKHLHMYTNYFSQHVSKNVTHYRFNSLVSIKIIEDLINFRAIPYSMTGVNVSSIDMIDVINVSEILGIRFDNRFDWNVFNQKTQEILLLLGVEKKFDLPDVII